MTDQGRQRCPLCNYWPEGCTAGADCQHPDANRPKRDWAAAIFWSLAALAVVAFWGGVWWAASS